MKLESLTEKLKKPTENEEMDALLKQIRACQLCAANIPFPPRPVLAASAHSKIIIISQAPGLKVQESGIPFNDRSGIALREWLGVTDKEFYDREIFGIIPMGFCYPGRGKGGDLPPSKECAPMWHSKLIDKIEGDPLILLIGQYAQKYYLGKERKQNLTENVANFEEYLPKFFPLPHPSPRNFIWMNKNPWFQHDVLPALKEVVHKIIF